MQACTPGTLDKGSQQEHRRSMQIGSAMMECSLEVSKRIEPSMARINVQNDQTAWRTGRNANICLGPVLPPVFDDERIDSRIIDSMGNQRKFATQREYRKTSACVGQRCFRKCDVRPQNNVWQAMIQGDRHR